MRIRYAMLPVIIALLPFGAHATEPFRFTYPLGGNEKPSQVAEMVFDESEFLDFINKNCGESFSSMNEVSGSFIVCTNDTVNNFPVFPANFDAGSFQMTITKPGDTSGLSNMEIASGFQIESDIPITISSLSSGQIFRSFVAYTDNQLNLDSLDIEGNSIRISNYGNDPGSVSGKVTAGDYFDGQEAPGYISIYEGDQLRIDVDRMDNRFEYINLHDGSYDLSEVNGASGRQVYISNDVNRQDITDLAGFVNVENVFIIGSPDITSLQGIEQIDQGPDGSMMTFGLVRDGMADPVTQPAITPLPASSPFCQSELTQVGSFPGYTKADICK